MKEYIQNIVFSTIGTCADEMQQECYVIGGYVRDIFLQRPSKDIDIVVIGNGIELAEKVCKQWGKKSRLQIFKNFGTAQIKYQDMEIEFVGARKESYRADSRKPIVENGTLEDDQNRRDFSINALAICLNKERFGELVDPFNGVRDIENKILRTPLNPDITFSDDPLRMIRCIRFATQLKFHIEENTLMALARNKERLSIISKERIADEIQKIMVSDKPSIGWLLLERCELLPYILPELEAMKGVDTKAGLSHKDNFYHTLEVLDNISKHSNNVWLRWGALLHDIAKPVTKKYVQGIGWTFYNHNYLGERMVARIFNQMKLPMNEKMKYVQKMVLLHMRPIALVEEGITDSAVRRLLFDAGDDIDDLMTLCEADITSKNEAKVQKFLQNLQLVRKKLKDIEEKDKVRNFQPPVSGQEIMEVFQLPACATVGTIKTRIKDAILDGEIPNEYEAAKALMLRYGKELGLQSTTQN
jgi:poly(A) polymerase